MPVYVQYGCGSTAPEGWQNFDTSPTLRLQRLWLIGRVAPGPRFPALARVGDIVKGLPVPDGTADAVYCSHVLEHLALDDFTRALANTYRILKPGGVFRLVLPDLRQLAEAYVKAHDVGAAKKFMEDSYLGLANRPRGIGGFVRMWLGNSKHLWMWDCESLSAALAQAGFVKIRRAFFGDNQDAMFAKVEDKGRWDGNLGMECEKPAGS